jgi:hypothetical protein
LVADAHAHTTLLLVQKWADTNEAQYAVANCKQAFACGKYGACIAALNKQIGSAEPIARCQELVHLRKEVFKALKWRHWYQYEVHANLRCTQGSYQPIC